MVWSTSETLSRNRNVGSQATTPLKGRKIPGCSGNAIDFLIGWLVTITCMLNSTFSAVLDMMNASTIHIPIIVAGTVTYAASLVQSTALFIQKEKLQGSRRYPTPPNAPIATTPDRVESSHR